MIDQKLWSSKRERERQTDRHSDRLTNRHTYRHIKTDRDIKTATDIQRDRVAKTDGQMKTNNGTGKFHRTPAMLSTMSHGWNMERTYSYSHTVGLQPYNAGLWLRGKELGPSASSLSFRSLFEL